MYSQGFVWKLGNYIETIKKARSCFEKTLCLGLVVFPDNEDIKELEKRYEEGLKMIGEGNAGKGVNVGNTSASRSHRENVEYNTPQIQKVSERATGSVTGGGGFDTPEYQIGMATQAEIIATADKVTSGATKGKSVAIDDGVPSFDLGFTQSYEELKNTSNGQSSGEKIDAVAAIPAIPISVCPPAPNEAEKREQQLTTYMRSPFVAREVDFTPLNAEEKKANSFLFELDGDPE